MWSLHGEKIELFVIGKLHFWSRVHKAFQVQDQDQAQVSKWILSGLVPIICSRKLDLCIHWHGKCCFRPKMHNIKLYVNYNKVKPVI